jgi:hypothetical protein
VTSPCRISLTSPPRTLRDVEPQWAFVKTEAADSDKTSSIFPVALHAARNTRRDLNVWRTIMENMHGGPSGPQLYLLSEEGYEEVRFGDSQIIAVLKQTEDGLTHTRELRIAEVMGQIY